MRTRSVQVQGATLAVREWGDDGTPLLYWHGLSPFGALELNEAGPAWSADGFRVVAFAAPGITDPRPFTDLEAYRPSRLAGLILRTAEELGIERFAYVGWSWGASIGVHFGARHGDRLDALVLLDAGHTDVTGDARRPFDDVIADFTAQQER
ncbi:MAG TPA: alpha/beta hydrolase, partial [Gaiellaceae bacterium]|nr:alpha/beta hydrolase [Gaiellaceae bacterium]